MFEYIVITYNKDEIIQDDCFRFKSNYDDCDIDPYGDNVPFAIGSNQSVVKLEDCPLSIHIDELEYLY